MKFALLGIVVWLAVVYVPHVRSAAFVYEDMKYLEGVPVAPLSASVLRGRGLSTDLWGVLRTPQGAHLLNILLHLAVVALSGCLLLRLTGSAWVGLAVAALMAVHPLTVQGVAYASSRGELIAAVGVLVALLCASGAHPAWWGLLPVGLGLAYLGKETGLIGVALVPLTIWLKGDRVWAWRLVALGGSAAWLYAITHLPVVRRIAGLAEYGWLDMSPGAWIGVQLAAVWRLIVLSVAPLWLTVDPPIRMQDAQPVIPILMLMAGLAEIAWRLKDRAPLVTFGLAGMALVAAPRFLVRTPLSPFNEHQWYLAMPFVACVLVGLIQLAAEYLDARQDRWRLA